MKQSGMEEILRDYTAGKLDARQANQELKKLGASLRLQPDATRLRRRNSRLPVWEILRSRRKDTDCWIPVPALWKRCMCTRAVWSMQSTRCSRMER